MSVRRALITSLSAALALGCPACVSSTHTTTRRPAPAPHTAAARAASTSATGTATTSAGATATTSSSLPGAGKPAVVIGDKNYTEQFILGQLYLLALKAQGFTVTINQNIGPTDVTRRALQSGALTMYPEYLDTFDSAVARYRHPFRSRASALRAAQRYALAHGLALLAATPFSDTDAIAVTVAFAREDRLRTIYDLRRVAATMAIAGPPQFATADPGLPALSDAYGVTPMTFKKLPVGAQYAALNAGSVQAAYVTTTDGQLASGDYRLLADHRHVFGWGNVIPVVSARALTAEGPAFAETIERVNRALTTPVIRRLNWTVDVAKQDPAAVARQFLQTHGLLEPLGATP